MISMRKLLTKEYDKNGNRIPTPQGKTVIKAAVKPLGINPDVCRFVDVGTRFTPYLVIQWEENGMIFQFNFETKRIRHKGNGDGCFWTDWDWTN